MACTLYSRCGKIQSKIVQSDETPSDGLAALTMLTEKTGVAIPAPLGHIAERTVRFTGVIDADEMPAEVLRFASDVD